MFPEGATLRETQCGAPEQVRTFTAESFRTPREWIYFCIEFDLEICNRCHRRARKRGDGEAEWQCRDCEPQFHPALIEVLATRRNVATTCHLCQAEIAIRDGWISEDCRRIYCSAHLKPLTKDDRFRLARRYLRARLRPRDAAGPAPGTSRADRLTEPMHRLAEHYDAVDCESCAFNAVGIYDGDRLIEIDRGARSCDCAPDTLNCANLEI